MRYVTALGDDQPSPPSILGPAPDSDYGILWRSPFEYCSEMGLAQFVHEGLPQRWAAGGEKFGRGYVLVGRRKMSNSPRAELDENGDEFDCRSVRV
jgi:hypothetical protein